MRFLFFAIACFVASSATAQGWSVSQLSAGFGQSAHQVNQRNSERLFSLAPASVIPSQNLIGYTATHTAKEKASFTSIQVEFVHNEPAKFNLERVIRLGLQMHVDRKGGTTYEQKTATPQGELKDQWNAQLIDDELGLAVDYVLRKHFDAHTLYSGIGGNVGIALGGVVRQTRLVYYEGGSSQTNDLYADLNTAFETAPSYFFRATIPFGVAYSLGPFGVGAEYGVGATFNKAGGQPNLFSSNVLSFRLGMEFGS
jgi:hypothetical protein